MNNVTAITITDSQKRFIDAMAINLSKFVRNAIDKEMEQTRYNFSNNHDKTKFC